MLKFDGKKEVAKIGLSLAHPLLIPCSSLAQSEDVKMLMDFVSLVFNVECLAFSVECSLVLLVESS